MYRKAKKIGMAIIVAGALANTAAVASQHAWLMGDNDGGGINDDIIGLSGFTWVDSGTSYIGELSFSTGSCVNAYSGACGGTYTDYGLNDNFSSNALMTALSAFIASSDPIADQVDLQPSITHAVPGGGADTIFKYAFAGVPGVHEDFNVRVHHFVETPGDSTVTPVTVYTDTAVSSTWSRADYTWVTLTSASPH